MKKLIIILFCLFIGCLSAQQKKEYLGCEEMKEAEKAGRVLVEIYDNDPYLYIIWKNAKGEIIKAGRILLPWANNKL